MPDFIYNKLTISGNKKTVEKCLSFLHNEGNNCNQAIDYECLFPIPEEFIEIRPHKDAMSMQEMSWRLKYWGVKWNACEVSVSKRNIIKFTSPWTTPNMFFIQLSRKFASLVFILEFKKEFHSKKTKLLFYKSKTFV